MSTRHDWDFTAWVADLTQEEADAIGDAICDIVCGGSGEGDDHTCQRHDWVASYRHAKADES